ncbi:2-amino-4-hydroxy-6-hydroxymethyldihydropteridine diphosphokinase [Rathayibacter soli]|uniref:2-amino-4-hydroxy-6- hydroxymethyldihydropteridine diphosphokinase n=1 Tax=Rathayibacter soli TaxID=3144168 RepID=UPI0027E4790C|nr:2-amino-4-hydroxy-6-hydroxymethyldihydropteridine diphosphokinase [Glaciibacter superstes]
MTGGIHRPKPQRLKVGVPAVLALGSNLGDRVATLAAAVADLDATPGIRVEARSMLVETDAIKLSGVDRAAPRYLNAVVLIDTTLDPYALLSVVNAIEAQHGRVREVRWGDRTLDIDIVDYDGRFLSDERLTLPHPRAAERAFVLAPWLDVDAHARVPGAGRVVELLAKATDAVHPYQEASGWDGIR